jgi:hypothetical protein
VARGKAVVGIQKCINYNTKGTDDLWKDIYDVCTDTTQTRLHECLLGSKELNRYTGDGVGPENKLTVSTILLDKGLRALFF